MKQGIHAVKNIPDSDPTPHSEPGGDVDHGSKHDLEQEKFEFEKSLEKEIKREHGKTRKDYHK